MAIKVKALVALFDIFKASL